MTSGVPGVKEHGFTLWSMEDAVKMRALSCAKAAKEHDPQKRKALLTFAALWCWILLGLN